MWNSQPWNLLLTKFMRVNAVVDKIQWDLNTGQLRHSDHGPMSSIQMFQNSSMTGTRTF